VQVSTGGFGFAAIGAAAWAGANARIKEGVRAAVIKARFNVDDFMVALGKDWMRFV
jgi:hypothetical protein